MPDLSAPKATLAALVLLVTALEAGTSRDDWRRPQRATGLYLTQLEAWGYALSDVENAATGRVEYATPTS